MQHFDLWVVEKLNFCGPEFVNCDGAATALHAITWCCVDGRCFAIFNFVCAFNGKFNNNKAQKSTSNILDLNSLTNNDYSQLVPCSLVFFNARFVSLIIETMLFDACLASTLVTKKCSHRCAAQIPISRQDLKRHKQSTFLLPWSGLFSPLSRESSHGR